MTKVWYNPRLASRELDWKGKNYIDMVDLRGEKKETNFEHCLPIPPFQFLF